MEFASSWRAPLKRMILTRPGQIGVCMALISSGVVTPLAFATNQLWLTPCAYVFVASAYALWWLAFQRIDALFSAHLNAQRLRARRRARGPKPNYLPQPDYLPLIRKAKVVARFAVVSVALSVMSGLFSIIIHNIILGAVSIEVILVSIVALLSSLHVGANFRAV